MHDSYPVNNSGKNTCIQSVPAFQRHSDSALVTSGEFHKAYQHQVASVEVLMEFSMASCLGGLSHMPSRAEALSLILHKSPMCFGITPQMEVIEGGKLPTAACSGIFFF